jgi:hypothetical protein
MKLYIALFLLISLPCLLIQQLQSMNQPQPIIPNYIIPRSPIFRHSRTCQEYNVQAKYQQPIFAGTAYSPFQDYRGACRSILNPIDFQWISNNSHLPNQTAHISHAGAKMEFADWVTLLIMHENKYRAIYNQWKECVLCLGFNNLIGTPNSDTLTYVPREVDGGIKPRETDYQKKYPIIWQQYLRNPVTDFPDYLIRDVEFQLRSKNLYRAFL